MPHIHERIDFTVAAYITYNGKVLLVDHKAIGTWMPIGGHIELDEDPEQALIREVYEESGLEVEVIGGLKAPDMQGKGVKPLPAPVYMDIHDISDTHKHIGLVYFAKAKTDTVTLAKAEHRDIRWFNGEELQDTRFNVRPYIQYYARQALDAAL